MQGSNARPGVYFALIHGKLLKLYDSEEQRQCFGEILLGPDAIIELYPKSDLYVDEVYQKDFPIRLFKNQRSLYIYCGNGNEKEDWFYALRRAANPDTKIYNQQERKVRHEYFQKVSERLASSPPDCAWLNALIARMLYHQLHSQQLVETIKAKFLRRLAITPIPFFVGGVELREVGLGITSPLITSARHHYTYASGETLCSVDVSYEAGVGEGVFAILHTVLKLESRLTGDWAVPVSLLLRLVRLAGRLQVWLKAPPTDRVWIAFAERPEIEISIDTDRMSLNTVKPLIKSALERAVLDGIAESLLVPNFSDAPLPPVMFGNVELVEKPYWDSAVQPAEFKLGASIDAADQTGVQMDNVPGMSPK